MRCRSQWRCKAKTGPVAAQVYALASCLAAKAAGHTSISCTPSPPCYTSNHRHDRALQEIAQPELQPMALEAKAAAALLKYVPLPCDLLPSAIAKLAAGAAADLWAARAASLVFAQVLHLGKKSKSRISMAWRCTCPLSNCARCAGGVKSTMPWNISCNLANISEASQTSGHMRSHGALMCSHSFHLAAGPVSVLTSLACAAVPVVPAHFRADGRAGGRAARPGDQRAGRPQAGGWRAGGRHTLRHAQGAPGCAGLQRVCLLVTQSQTRMTHLVAARIPCVLAPNV